MTSEKVYVYIPWEEGDERFNLAKGDGEAYKDEGKKEKEAADEKKLKQERLKIHMGVIAATSGLDVTQYDGIQISPITVDAGTGKPMKRVFRRVVQNRSKLDVDLLLANGVTAEQIQKSTVDTPTDSWRVDDLVATPIEMAAEMERLRTKAGE